jgi:hypothetical protein
MKFCTAGLQLLYAYAQVDRESELNMHSAGFPASARKYHEELISE